MDELDIGGKKYISSKRAADLTGYAKDYVGQLARGGKIDATRVGRAWYVLKDAILGHASVDPSPNIPDEPNADGIESVTPSSQAKIAATTIGHVSLLELRAPREVPRTWGDVNYSSENLDLFPVLKRDITPVVEVIKNTAQNNDEIVKVPITRKIISTTSKIPSPGLDGIVHSQKIITVQVAAQQKVPQPSKTEVQGSKTPGYMAPLLAVAVVFFGATLSGAAISTHFGFAPEKGVLGADAVVGSDNLSYAMTSGSEALGSFYHQIMSSFSQFFTNGLTFITEFSSRLLEIKK